jgi:hypothetical protein
MLKADIKRAVALIKREGGSKAADRLVLAVKASATAAKLFKDNLKEALRAEYDESEVKRLGRGGDMVVGFLIRASGITEDYYIFDADLAGLLVDAKGDVVGYYHSGEVVTIRPENMTLRGATVIDDNSEAHQDIMACAQALVYGNSGGRNAPYYAESTGRRYNPSSRENGSASHPFGFAKVQSGRVVKLSDAQRKPAGAGWGAVNTSNTRIGSHAYLDGGTVYLR